MSADAAAQDLAAIEANEKVLVGLLDDAEQQLSSTTYLAGSSYSVADVMFTPVLFRLGMANKTGEYLKPRPKVSEYYNRYAEGCQSVHSAAVTSCYGFCMQYKWECK